MIQAQQARDQKILKLVMAMEETFSFIVLANELKTRERLQDIINQILRQTIKCGYFIQDYTRHHFGGKGQRHLQRDNEMTKYLPERTIVQPFSGIDDQITVERTETNGEAKRLKQPSIRITLYTYKQVRALSSVVYEVSST